MELADLLPDLAAHYFTPFGGFLLPPVLKLGERLSLDLSPAAHVLALLLMALLFTLGRLARRAFTPRAE